MFCLVVLSIVLMILDKRGDTFAGLRAAISMPLAPLQYAVSWPVQIIDRMRTAISSHDALVQENLDLKAEQLLLKAQVQRLLALESENSQLKALLRSSAEVQGKVLVAQILAVDTEPFVNQVSIDKGSRDGLFVGQPVLDATGVMGQVIQVGPFASQVLLSNDPHSGIPVMITRNGMRSIAVGDLYTGKLHLANLSQTADVVTGDLLVTSGLGQNYPEGYPVGQVISVVKDPGLQFATIVVEPSAHLDRSRQVLLVWPNKMLTPAPVVAPKKGVPSQATNATSKRQAP